MGRVQVANRDVEASVTITEESQPRPSLKGQWLETVLLDLVLLDS